MGMACIPGDEDTVFDRESGCNALSNFVKCKEPHDKNVEQDLLM